MAFLVLNCVRYPGKYPVGIIDGLGDWMFLPAFNAIAVRLGILDVLSSNAVKIGIAFGVAYVLTCVFMIWRRDIEKKNDWTRPKLHVFNGAGYYHLVFMFVESAFIILSLSHLWMHALLWAPIVAFLVVVAVRFKTLADAKHLPKC